VTGDVHPSWQPWQEEYRFGAFYLFPPPPVADVVNALRWRHDPTSAAICDAHVSLSEPLTGTFTQAQRRELTFALSREPCFEVHYGPVTTLGDHPGVVMTLEPRERVFALRATVHATSIFDGRPTPRADRAPHLTIAEFISLSDSLVLVASLADVIEEGSFLCDHVVYAVPDESFHFTPVEAFALGPVTSGSLGEYVVAIRSDERSLCGRSCHTTDLLEVAKTPRIPSISWVIDSLAPVKISTEVTRHRVRFHEKFSNSSHAFESEH
jgi:hypothetical protein